MEVPATQTFSFLRFLKFAFLAIFIGLILIEAVYNCAHEHSLTPFITTIGNKLIYATNELSVASKQVITQGNWYIPTPNFWSGAWNFILLNMNFYTSFYTFFMWIWVFSWLIARTPFSDTTKVFQNYFFALVIFFLIQGIFILAMAGVSKNINCFSGCEQGAIEYLISPITSFKDFFSALYIILTPAFHVANNIDKPANITFINGTQ